MHSFVIGFYKQAGIREVATVGVIADGKLLMGKRRDNQKLTCPGGHLEPGEDPLEGAKRELFEEAGIRADKLTHLISKKVVTPKGKHLTIHAYKYLTDKVPTSMKADPDLEVTRWVWYPMPLSQEVLDNLHSPDNVLLQALGLQEITKEASVNNFWNGFEKRAVYVTNLLKEIGANNPLTRKHTAMQIRKGRAFLQEELKGETNKYHRRMGSTMQAFAKGTKGEASLEFPVSGLPVNTKASNTKGFKYPREEYRKAHGKKPAYERG